MSTLTLLYFGFLIVIGVVQFSTTFIIPKENDKLEEFRFSKHDLKRFRREKCETLLYYDVSCHGLCPYTEKDWEKNKIYKNCTDGLVYHCARDNATNKYVEACAEAVWCDRGKEPRLIFPPGHNKKARVICRYCHDEDFYNPIEFRLSSTYYECTEYKIPCSRYGIGKIRCDEDGIERHWKDNKCRCNERNMYIESNAACPTDLPCKNKTNFDFTCELYDCGKTSEGYWRNLTEDYCCACEDGYIRNETTNKCHKSSHVVSSRTMNISHDHTKTVMATVMMSYKVEIDISASTNSATHRNTISYIQPTVTARPSGGQDSKHTITIVVLALVILIFIVGIVCYNRTKICKKKGHDEPYDSLLRKKMLTETSMPNNQNAGASVSSASVQETSFANNRNAGGSAQLQSDSSASVQDSSTRTTTNVFSKENDMLIEEIGKITMQQEHAKIRRQLNDKLTKEHEILEKLRVSSSVIQNAACIDHLRIASVNSDISQESCSVNKQNAPDPAQQPTPTPPLNTESEVSSSVIQNAACIGLQRIASVNSDISQESSSANDQSVPCPAPQLSKTTAPVNTESEEPSSANNHNEAGSAQIPIPRIPVVPDSEI